MSIDATRWAWMQSGLTVTQKIILLSLADRADEMHRCWPRHKRLREDTGISNKHTIIDALKVLEDKGLVLVQRINGKGNTYILQGVPGREDGNTSAKTGTGAETGTTPVPKVAPAPVPKVAPHESIREPFKNQREGSAHAPVSLPGQDSAGPAPPRGSFGNVSLSAVEYAKLKADHPDKADAAVEKLSLHKEASGKAYKSDYAAILKWALKAVDEDRAGQGEEPARSRPPLFVAPPDDDRPEMSPATRQKVDDFMQKRRRAQAPPPGPPMSPAQKALGDLERELVMKDKGGFGTSAELEGLKAKIEAQRQVVEQEKAKENNCEQV